MVGEVFQDRYELEELVGSGGMSSVYRARDRLLDRRVALKILHAHHLQDPESVRRFRQEARSVAALSHPNIVTVIDRGEHDGRQFIVFEYVDGRNLKQLIRDGRIPVERALELAIQIARALSFAHRSGLVHRDVKPQNVLLNGDGQAKVTDFGIARSLTVQQGTTQTGTVLGTSDYVAPEQAQGQHVDEQSDVYALGVVLYELLTGDVPFPGDSFVAVAMRHINEPAPSAHAKRPDVSPRLDAAVQRAMAKDPADRFPTMADFGRELEACMSEDPDGTQVIAPPAPVIHGRRRVSPWPVVLVLLGVLAAVAAVAYFLFGRGTGSTTGGSTPTGAAVVIGSPTAYDPYGTGTPGENNREAPNATDGNATSYWSTEKYDSSLASIHKLGVGLVVDAHEAVALRSLVVTTDTPGFTAQVKAGDSTTNFPDDVGSSQTVVGRVTRFSLNGTPHRYYLVWITNLGPNHAVHVNEVTATR